MNWRNLLLKAKTVGLYLAADREMRANRELQRALRLQGFEVSSYAESLHPRYRLTVTLARIRQRSASGEELNQKARDVGQITERIRFKYDLTSHVEGPYFTPIGTVEMYVGLRQERKAARQAGVRVH